MIDVILNPERIAQIRARLAALSAEEWGVVAIHDNHPIADIVSDGGSIVATAYRGVAGDPDSHKKCARFIAAARQDVPDLLLEREALVAAFDGIGSALGTVTLDATALVMTPGQRLIEGVRVVRESLRSARLDRDVAVQRMHDKEAERLELVEELRQEREMREAFEDALALIATHSVQFGRRELINLAEQTLRNHLPHAIEIEPEPAPIEAQEPA